MQASVVRAVVRRVIGPVTAAVLLCGVGVGDAQAQSGALEVRGGYAFVADTDFNFPFGWYADIAVPLRGTMSLVGEIGQSRTTVVELGVPIAFSVTSFQGGVRLQARNGSVRPFLNAIGGVTRASGGVNVSNVPGVGSFDVNITTTAFTIQPGGGVVVLVTPRFGITVGADYRWGGSDLGSLNEFRFATGVLVGLGSR